jgi:uncharacterized protein
MAPQASGSPHAATLVVELRVPDSQSLKAKRSVVRHVVATARSRFEVAAAEVGHQDQWQRSTLAFSAVGGTVGHVGAVLDTVSRFVWAQPGLEVLAEARYWTDIDR